MLEFAQNNVHNTILSSRKGVSSAILFTVTVGDGARGNVTALLDGTR